MRPVERTLLAFTTTLISAGVAHAAPPPLTPTQTQTSIPTVAPASVVLTSPLSTRHPAAGMVFARQPVVPPVAPTAAPAGRARSRVIFLNRDGTVVSPGVNDSSHQTSSLVREPTAITSWDIDDEMWSDTIACMRELFDRFDVTITDRDPGDVPHIEAVFGGHPSDVGLPDNVAGVSPFATNCSVIESSVVFTFTDVLPDDARLMCEIMAQEIAHSYGLDHQLLAEDPMSYLDYPGERTFQDEDAACGEFEARPCGIGDSICRPSQNSVELLTQRLGPSAPAAGNSDQGNTTPGPGVVGGGCAAGGEGSGAGLAFALGLLAARRRRRR